MCFVNSVQVQTYLKASTQLEEHLCHILLFATFPSLATNSFDSRIKETGRDRRIGAFSFCAYFSSAYVWVGVRTCVCVMGLVEVNVNNRQEHTTAPNPLQQTVAGDTTLSETSHINFQLNLTGPRQLKQKNTNTHRSFELTQTYFNPVFPCFSFLSPFLCFYCW